MIEDQNKDTLIFAGAARIDLNDWFFAKEKIILKYISLSKATINLKRSTKKWNYQFIADYFQSSDAEKKQRNLIFDFKKIHLSDTHFNLIDEWKGTSMLTSVKQLDASISFSDLKKQVFKVEEITLVQPGFSLVDFEGKRSAAETLIAQSTSSNQNDGSFFNIDINHIKIVNGIFNSDQQTKRAPYSDIFDPLHFTFASINGELKNLKITQDGFRSSIHASSIERNGLQVKNIEADMSMDSSIMEFKNLDIITNNSHLRNYYAMRYNNFDVDMSEFISNVELEGDFKNSLISTDDIALFAPELKDMHRNIALSGHAKGTINYLKADHVNLTSNSTSFKGDIDIRDMTQIDEMFLKVNAKEFNTNYNELNSLFPQIKNIKTPHLNLLQNINYIGNYTGYLNSFVAKGMLKTSLGSIDSDIKIDLTDIKMPTYSGHLITNNFNLGKFTGINNMGNLSIDGFVNGKGFSLNNVNTQFKGEIPLISFDGYPYKNITLNGSLQNKLFNGSLSINDPNVKISTLNGEISFKDKVPTIKLKASIDKLSFKPLNITNQDLHFSGDLEANLSGTNIDDFYGNANISNASLINDTNHLSFNYLKLSSSKNEDGKSIKVQSNQFKYR